MGVMGGGSDGRWDGVGGGEEGVGRESDGVGGGEEGVGRRGWGGRV